MSIITKAGTPSKGSPTQFTLSKSALAAVTSVAADSYFSDSTNWKEVSLVYKSSTGKQKEILKFDASLASPTANFSVSVKALDVFEINKIIIRDFDGGSFEVPRSQLTTAEFDVDMGVAPALTAYRYYKINFGTSYTSRFAAAPMSGWFVVLTELALKVNGTTTYPTAIDSSGWNKEGSLFDSLAVLTDGTFDRGIGDIYTSTGGSANIIMDMGSSVSATDLLIGPRCSPSQNPSLSNDGYFPANIVVSGSNDYVSFTQIKDAIVPNSYVGNQFQSISLVSSPSYINWDNKALVVDSNTVGGLSVDYYSGGSPGWGRNAYSVSNATFGLGAFSYTFQLQLNAAEFSVGIKSSVPILADQGYADNNYAFYFNSNHFYISIGSNYTAIDCGSYSGWSPVLKIERDAMSTLRFYIDGVQVHSAVYIESSTYPKISLYSSNKGENSQSVVLASSFVG